MSFMAFENFEEMIEYMAKRTDEANATLAPEQRQITYGHCWVNFGAMEQIGVPVFGRVFTEEEVFASEMGHAEGQAETAQSVLESTRENHERGYMYGDAYSRYYPRAESGDTHRADMWPITDALFHAVEAVGWDQNALELADKIDLSIAFEQWRAHLRELQS